MQDDANLRFGVAARSRPDRPRAAGNVAGTPSSSLAVTRLGSSARSLRAERSRNRIPRRFACRVPRSCCAGADAVVAGAFAAASAGLGAYVGVCAKAAGV